MHVFDCRAPLAAVTLATALITGAFPALLRAEIPQPDVKRLQSSAVLRHLKPNPMPAKPQTAPEQTVAQMYVPEGFRVELVVAEPDLHQPVAMAIDERGRLWVAEAYSYPQKQPAGKGLDKIVIFEDRDGDGKFETRKVFAEGLNLVSGFELGYGGVWVGAAPELLFIADRNHDDVPDGLPQVLLDGFGYQDTHECLNSFLWGPDGWLYGNQGVFNYAKIGKPGTPDEKRTELRAGIWRYHPVRHEFEVFASGGSNPWGLDFDERGQIFLTHCRSYWGRGLTTHAVQGGHYWNQANANYAPFIIADPPKDLPDFRNFLLASARYDHGAGGAGVPGSDAVYGGHSHVGTMIYLGDNWPDEYRGHLFTHNLHGHQINQQINQRMGSGFNTVHAGRDQLFCSDPMYVPVDLQYGPDGAVYMIDWYDQQHCHNPNTERWDRTNGRIYRMQYAATYKPVKVDLGNLDDARLVELQNHKNDWHARTARRLLHERSLSRGIDARAKLALFDLAGQATDPARRLRALWSLHAVGALSEELTLQSLRDQDEYMRGWAIQLATDKRHPSARLLAEFVKLAKSDPSPVVRLYLASAIQRVPETNAWQLIEALAAHSEDTQDRNLPLLLWDGLAQRMPGNLDRAFTLAKQTGLPLLADYIYWYAAVLDADALNRVVASLDQSLDDRATRRRLAGLEMAVNARGTVATPAAWKGVAPRLYASKEKGIQRAAEQLAGSFGDDSRFPQLRETLANPGAEKDARRHAFAVLGRTPDSGSLNVFLKLLDDDTFRAPAINLLARFSAPSVAEALLAKFGRFAPAERAATLNALASRPNFALALLDAVAAGRIKRDQLTAFHVRQLTELKNPEIDRRVNATWGKIGQTPAEKQELISRLEHVFDEAPLWAYDGGGAGKQLFVQLCATCHKIGNDGVRIGPELTGAGKNGIKYFLENIIDPNAVIGTDFQLTTVETTKGDTISGLVINETPGALTLRTTAEQIILPKAEISKRATSDKSLMPEGLLEGLPGRQQIELLKFLVEH